MCPSKPVSRKLKAASCTRPFPASGPSALHRCIAHVLRTSHKPSRLPLQVQMSLTSKRPKPSTTVHPVWTGPDSAKKRRPAATKPQAGLTTQHHTTHESTACGRCSQIFVSLFFSRSLVQISIVTLSANPSRKDLPSCAQSAFPPQGTRPPFHPYVLSCPRIRGGLCHDEPCRHL